ncbi:muts domain V-domain-containing protein [Flagelloscypha sp. PMI_526]|nr:muts domain V-domain-containing protein [Flagelloscypha sp. PMI_526]
MYGGTTKESAGQDKDTDVSFIPFFNGLEKKSPTSTSGTLRLFHRLGKDGDYYCAYGPDARFVAQHTYRTNNVLKYLGAGSKQLESLSIKTSVAKTLLREALTALQLKIEIYEPESSKKGAKFNLDKQASPGNLQAVDDLLFSSSLDSDAEVTSAPVVVAVKLASSGTGNQKLRNVTIAYADTALRELGVTEFNDNDLFSSTESTIIQLSAKEAIIPQGTKTGKTDRDYELNKLRSVLERCNIMITERKGSEFQTKSILEDVPRLLKGDSTSTEVESSSVEASVALQNNGGALNALTTYLSLFADPSNFGTWTLKPHSLTSWMKLDSSALRALSLADPPGQMGRQLSKNTTLPSLLNRCKTAQGTRMLGAWLRMPLINKHEILKRQTLVQLFVSDETSRQKIQDEYLKYIPDLHRLCKRFTGGSANLENVVRVYQLVLKLPGLIESLENVSPPPAEDDDAMQDQDDAQTLVQEFYLAVLKEAAVSLEKYSSMVEETLDLEQLDHNNYVVRPEYDPELEEIAGQLAAARDGLDEEHRLAASDLDLPIDKKIHLENNATYGYCLRVTKKDADGLKKKRYIELSTLKGGTFFTTQNLREHADNYKTLTQQYQRKQSALVKDIVGIAATYTTVLESLDDVVAHLDVILSFAHVSVNAPEPYIRPKILDRGAGKLDLREARHPCLEVQDDVSFIANDVLMEKDKSELQIITGPNMGGKSTYIRSIGTIALMAQTGCFVPCQSATIPIFDSILCRVGAGDSMLKGVSTFMAEMLETASILRTATKDSLIIIDELGRGTSTYDGFGLAWAISEHIATKINAFCLFATHFHELTALDQQIPSIKNLHVVAHVSDDGKGSEDITLLYKVEPGISDQSFGIHVARLANFPDHVVKLAKRKADELEDFGTDDSKQEKFSDEVTSEGVQIIEKIMKEWTSDKDGDALMEDVNHDDTERQVEELKRIMAQYKGDIEGNAWLGSVIDSLY